LRLSVKLRTSTPGYIAERACRASRPTWGMRHSVKLRTSTPGYIAERECREERLDLAGRMTSPTQCTTDDNLLFLESEVGNVARHPCPRCQRQTRAAWLPTFVYLKHAGKQRLWLSDITWVSDAVTLSWGRQKPPGIRHEYNYNYDPHWRKGFESAVYYFESFILFILWYFNHFPIRLK
jgi:hypothetical protein